MADNIDQIHESFARQAETFEVTHMNVQRREHMDHIIDLLAPIDCQNILEVAAGTCACGRAMAPSAAAVACLDTTEQMLEIGRREAENADIHNMVFVLGDAGNLPFLDESFDITFCRLAFHHIPDYKKPFSEMARTLKRGGKLVLIDLVAPEESLRQVKENMEIERDPSHVHTLSRDEMLSLFDSEDLAITVCENSDLPVSLEDWLDVTKPSEQVCEDIREKMKAEILGGAKTGFDPYEKDGRIFFYQHWLLLIGQKQI